MAGMEISQLWLDTPQVSFKSGGNPSKLCVCVYLYMIHMCSAALESMGQVRLLHPIYDLMLAIQMNDEYGKTRNVRKMECDPI